MQSVNPLDEAAFTELYVQHVDAVYRICYSFLKNRTDAEDAVQETFLRLMQSQKPLENDAHLRGWLVVTASNVCKNMLHSWLWQKRQEVEDWEEVLKSDNQTPEETAVLKALMVGIKPEIYIMGPSIGAHVGPGAVACGWLSTKTRTELGL